MALDPIVQRLRSPVWGKYNVTMLGFEYFFCWGWGILSSVGCLITFSCVLFTEKYRTLSNVTREQILSPLWTALQELPRGSGKGFKSRDQALRIPGYFCPFLLVKKPTKAGLISQNGRNKNYFSMDVTTKNSQLFIFHCDKVYVT